MDRRIIQWVTATLPVAYSRFLMRITQDTKGTFVLQWPQLDIRILELVITPDGRRLVAIGQLAQPISISNEHTPSAHALATTLQASAGVQAPAVTGNSNGTSVDTERRIVMYDLETRQEIWFVRNFDRRTHTLSICRSQSVWGELQSVKISDDSRFALINHQQGVRYGSRSLWRLLILSRMSGFGTSWRED